MIRMLGLLLCTSFLYSMCTEPPPDQLTYKQRKLGDSIAKVEMKRMGDSLDSICQLHFEKYVQKAYDSILDNRRQEIKRLME